VTESCEHGKGETCGFHTIWVISSVTSHRIISSMELVHNGCYIRNWNGSEESGALTSFRWNSAVYLEGLRKTTDNWATMIVISVDIQNAHVPKTSKKSCNLSQISGPQAEVNLGFKDLGAKQIRAEKVPLVSCQTNELISCSIKKKLWRRTWDYVQCLLSRDTLRLSDGDRHENTTLDDKIHHLMCTVSM